MKGCLDGLYPFGRVRFRQLLSFRLYFQLILQALVKMDVFRRRSCRVLCANDWWYEVPRLIKVGENLHTFYQSHRPPPPIYSPIHRQPVPAKITSPSLPPDLQNLKEPPKNFSKPSDVVPSPTISAPPPDTSTSTIGKSAKPSAWMNNVTCFTCGERGHYATQCTSANPLSAEESRRVREHVLSQKTQLAASSYGQSSGNNGGYSGSDHDCSNRSFRLSR